MVGLGSLDRTLRHFDQPEAIQLREIRLPARALDDRLGDFLRHGVVEKTFADGDRLPQQSDGYVAIQRPQPQFARTDEGVIPQRPEFLERRIPCDQQPHSPTVLNGRPQQPYQLHDNFSGMIHSLFNCQAIVPTNRYSVYDIASPCSQSQRISPRITSGRLQSSFSAGKFVLASFASTSNFKP